MSGRTTRTSKEAAEAAGKASGTSAASVGPPPAAAIEDQGSDVVEADGATGSTDCGLYRRIGCSVLPPCHTVGASYVVPVDGYS